MKVNMSFFSTRTAWFGKILSIYLMSFFMVSLILYRSMKERSFTTIIHSGLVLNSFNPSIIHLTLNKHFSQANFISIRENNIVRFQVTNPSTITMILSDGYHQLDLIVLDPIEHIEYYQTIEISTGSQSLLVTVFDQQYRPMKNISVHVELVDYPQIHLDSRTNQIGEVIFRHLPRQVQVYIEATCMTSKRQASARINTFNYPNLTLVLKEMSFFYDEEYDVSDRGYYAV